VENVPYFVVGRVKLAKNLGMYSAVTLKLSINYC
jgi:hypothetical protein